MALIISSSGVERERRGVRMWISVYFYLVKFRVASRVSSWSCQPITLTWLAGRKPSSIASLCCQWSGHELSHIPSYLRRTVEWVERGHISAFITSHCAPSVRPFVFSSVDILFEHLQGYGSLTVGQDRRGGTSAALSRTPWMHLRPAISPQKYASCYPSFMRMTGIVDSACAARTGSLRC